MEDNAKLIQALFERTIDYGKTSYELLKLRILEKTTDIVSSTIPQAIMFVIIIFLLLFANMGLAFWLGEILGETYYGFFIVSGFYAFVGLIVYLFMYKKLKMYVSDKFIKRVLK